MKSRTMVDYAEGLHLENERLRAADKAKDSSLRDQLRVMDLSRAVVASWEQWQCADEADKAQVWRFVETGMEGLREAVDNADRQN